MRNREPVAFDFIDLSGGATVDDGGATTSRSLIRRPMIPSVPDDRLRMARMPPPILPPARDQGFRNPGSSPVNRSSHFRRPGDRPVDGPDDRAGLRQQPWKSTLPVAPNYQSDKENSGNVASSSQRERELNEHGHLLGHHLSLASWPRHHGPASASAQHEEFARVQHARRVAFIHHARHQQAMQASHQRQAMNAGHQQASLGARSSPVRDGPQRALAQPSDPSTGPERFATQPHPPANRRGFVPPAPEYGRMKPTGAENAAADVADKMRPPPQQQPVPAASAPRPGGSGCKHPGTAQMTIFYASKVNVYDDVPIDMAQAVCMMLAGQGTTWPPSNGVCCPGRTHGAPAPVPPPSPSAPPPPPLQAPAATSARPAQLTAPGVVFSTVRRPTVATVELPQARKASLARFLEKRKDRVRKAPIKMEGEASPSPPLGKPPTRSPSPAPSVHNPRPLSPGFSGAIWNQQGAPRCSKPNSPTRPPPTPSRQNFSHENVTGSTSKRRSDFEIQQVQCFNKRSRNGKSPTRDVINIGSSSR